MEEQAPRARPPAVTVAAWLVIVPSSLGTVIGAILAFTRAGDPAVTPGVPEEARQLAGVIAAAFTLVLGALLVWIGMNLLRLRPWARTVTLILQALWLFTWVLLIAGDQAVHPIQHVIRGALPLSISLLLYTPTAIEAFVRPPPDRT